MYLERDFCGALVVAILALETQMTQELCILLMEDARLMVLDKDLNSLVT